MKSERGPVLVTVMLLSLLQIYSNTVFCSRNMVFAGTQLSNSSELWMYIWNIYYVSRRYGRTSLVLAYKCLCLPPGKILVQAVLKTLDKNLEKSIGDFDMHKQHLDQSLSCRWLSWTGERRYRCSYSSIHVYIWSLLEISPV